MLNESQRRTRLTTRGSPSSQRSEHGTGTDLRFERFSGRTARPQVTRGWPRPQSGRASPRAGSRLTIAEVVKGDLSDFEGLNTASAGVDAVFLMMPFSAGGNPFELMGNALKAAKEGGAKLLVFNAGGHPPSAPTGIPTVILCPGVYMENFLGPWCLPRVRGRGPRASRASRSALDARRPWGTTA